MDRRVKERLVGATILVVLIVLVVPELLSGRTHSAAATRVASTGPAEPVRSVTVDLATSKATTDGDTAASAAELPAAVSGAAAAGAAGRPAAPGAAALDAVPRSDPSAVESPGAGAGGNVVAGHVAAPPSIATLRAQQPVPPVEHGSSSSTSPAAPVGSGSHQIPVADAVHHAWAVQLGSFGSYANAQKLARRLKAHNASVNVSSSGTGAALHYRVRIGALADRGAAERLTARLKRQGLSASVVAP